MPFPMKIQPLDPQSYGESIKNETSSVATAKPVLKSRLKKLFDGVLKTSSSSSSTPVPEKPPAGGDHEAAAEFEPSSVCLAKMVQNFMEESNNEKQTAVKCGRNRCNCFNGNIDDSSDDDDFDVSSCFGDSIVTAPSSADSLDKLKGLIPCASVAERNLLADTSKIVEKNNKACKRKDDQTRVVTAGLVLLGHDASVCRSRWEKSTSYPAGEYEYIDVIVEGGERILIDIDFRSEFEIARSTSGYKSILQSLPHVFVGRPDRLHQIITVVSEAARQSLKKKGMHIPPWRKAEYMRSKWLSPYARTTTNASVVDPPNDAVREEKTFTVRCDCGCVDCQCSDLEIVFSEKKTSSSWELIEAAGGNETTPAVEEKKYTWQSPAIGPNRCEISAAGRETTSSAVRNSGEEKKYTWQPLAIERKCCVTTSAVENSGEEKKYTWQPPAIERKCCGRRARVVPGLASLLGETE